MTDPVRLLVRVFFAYAVLLVLVRLSGKHLVKHAAPYDFALALILSDMIDDALWADVHASVFVVGAGVLTCMHMAFDRLRARAGASLPKEGRH